MDTLTRSKTWFSSVCCHFPTLRIPCYAGWHRTLEECAALLFTESINSGSPNTGWQHSLPWWILTKHVARYKCVHSHSSMLGWYLCQCGPLRWNYCHSWQDDSSGDKRGDDTEVSGRPLSSRQVLPSPESIKPWATSLWAVDYPS